LISICIPWEPARAAAELTLKSPPPTAAEVQAERSPLSKLSVKMTSEPPGGGEAVNVGIGVNVGAVVPVAVSVEPGVGVLVGVNVEMGVPVLVAAAVLVGTFVGAVVFVAVAVAVALTLHSTILLWK
jgi:hypothetical protein